MSILQLDTENADRDLTSLVTVLTDTPDESNHIMCQGYIALGDGSKNLDGTGGQFELVITVGGQTVQPSPQIMTFGTEVRSAIWTTQFPVPANTEVIMQVKSPNSADTDVDITAYLFNTSPVDSTYIDTSISSRAPASEYDTEMARITADVATEAKQDIISTNIDEIEVAVITNAAGADIAADIIALKAVADTSALEANVETHVQTVIETNKLDHLVAVADDDDVVNNSIIAKLADSSATADWSAYDNTEDSLKKIRDKILTQSQLLALKD